LAEQLSASIGSQTTHVEPADPQLESARVLHSEPEQQPVGHDDGSQTHEPAAHRWPAMQAGCVPHSQRPAAEHALENVGSQVEQAPPGTPQVETERGLHRAPLQQPAGHEVASQTQEPPAQRWPEAQT
jgi:hypothetical protein